MTAEQELNNLCESMINDYDSVKIVKLVFFAQGIAGQLDNARAELERLKNDQSKSTT